MKNVENTFKDKIKSAANPEIAENRIWNKIEAKLDKKPKPVFVWWQIGIAASVIFLIGIAFLLNNKTVKTKAEIADLKNNPLRIKVKDVVNDVKEKEYKIKKNSTEFEKYGVKKNKYIFDNEKFRKEIETKKMVVEPSLKSKTIKDIPTVLLTDLLTNLKKEIKISAPENIGNKPKLRTIHADEYEQIQIESPVKQRAFVLKIGKQDEGLVETNSIIIPIRKSN
jgi:hypothetical protein